MSNQEDEGDALAHVPLTFFAYSRQDSEFVLKLANDLREAGAILWLDQLNIAHGERWDSTVEKALADCQHMLLVLSPDSVASQNVMDEVSFALEEHKLLIPILYRTCKIPFRVRRLQYIDLRTDYGRGLHHLLKRLGVGNPDRVAEPERFVPAAMTASAVDVDGTASSQTEPRSSAVSERSSDASPQPREAEFWHAVEQYRRLESVGEWRDRTKVDRQLATTGSVIGAARIKAILTEAPTDKATQMAAAVVLGASSFTANDLEVAHLLVGLLASPWERTRHRAATSIEHQVRRRLFTPQALSVLRSALQSAKTLERRQQVEQAIDAAIASLG